MELAQKMKLDQKITSQIRQILSNVFNVHVPEIFMVIGQYAYEDVEYRAYSFVKQKMSKAGAKFDTSLTAYICQALINGCVVTVENQCVIVNKKRKRIDVPSDIFMLMHPYDACVQHPAYCHMENIKKEKFAEHFAISIHRYCSFMDNAMHVLQRDMQGIALFDKYGYILASDAYKFQLGKMAVLRNSDRSKEEIQALPEYISAKY